MKNEEILVSVIIPAYNAEKYIAFCLDTVTAQTYRNLEIIVVDDGSKDSTGKICDEYAEKDSRIKVIHQDNKGVAQTRNVGLDNASGEYFAFIDSDDYIGAGMLRTLAGAIDRFHCDVIDFGFAVDTDGTITKRLVDDLPHDRTFTLAELPQLLLTQPNAWSRCWKRSLFLDTGIRYPSRVWYEDIRTTTKLFAAAGSICAVPDVFYYYVVREGSITRNPNIARNAEILDAFDDLLGWYRSSGLFAQYYNELSRLTVDHVLLAGSVRVLRIDPDSELLGRFQDYVKTQFPDYLDNPLLAQLSRSHKLILRLLRQRKYRTVRALFAAKDKLG